MQVNMSQDEPLYGALIISCSSSPPEDLVKLILELQELPESLQIHGKVTAYPWHIETKYYHADIHLFATNGKDLVSNSFADGVQAVIIYFDSHCSNRFEEVKSWQPFVEQFSPEVQMLVCDNCSHTEESRSDSLKKSDLLNWCLQNSYELVELNAEEQNSDDEAENDFKETTGCKRIIQALHAHLWPNMELKDNPNIGTTPARLEELLRTHEGSSAVLPEPRGSNNSGVTEDEQMGRISASDIQADFNIDADLFNPSSFENLFDRFKDMKEKANLLHGDERRQYAEKVAIAFWRAMGGDEEEITGLSSDDEQ